MPWLSIMMDCKVEDEVNPSFQVAFDLGVYHCNRKLTQDRCVAQSYLRANDLNTSLLGID